MLLIDAIEYQARTQPHAVAVIHGQRVVRYGELVSAVRRAATELAARGLAQGDVVGITMGNSPLNLVVLLALARLGAVSVAVHPFLSATRKKMVVDEYDVAAIVCKQPEAGVEGIQQIVADDSWLEAGASRGGWRRGAESGDLPWYIALSSGTTGRPKGVLRTQEQTLNLVLLQRTVIDISANARFLVLMDLNLTANLMRILRHLLAGSAIVFPRTTHDVESVFDAINRHGVTHTLVAPNTVSKWIAALPGRHHRMPGLVHLALGGGRVSVQLRQAIVENLTPNMFNNYGTTETGMVAVGDLEMHCRYPDSVGRVVPWARAQIVDEGDSPVPAGRSGIVRFRSIVSADGYYRNAEASAQTFRKGWVYPGDTGRLLRDGVLVIESRVDDIINVGGSKVDPAGIEDALTLHPDVAEAAVYGAKSTDGRDHLFAAVVLRGVVGEQALIEHCVKHVGQPAPERIIAVRELPRNEMGKVMRHELAERVRAEIRAAGASPAGRK